MVVRAIQEATPNKMEIYFQPGTQPKPIEVDNKQYLPGVYQFEPEQDWSFEFFDVGGEG